MAITADDIHKTSFSIDRKGYDVDEVDVFLEHVADEVDAMNNQIAALESQLDDSRFGGFDVPAHMDQPVQEQANDSAELEDKTARIAELEGKVEELERQLEAKKADDNAIAQALIIAQRSADEIMANAKERSASIIQDAKDEAQRILDRVEGEKQEVLDDIKKLEDDREDVREEYQELLKDFIGDATRKLAEIGGDASLAHASAHARPQVVSDDASDATGKVFPVQTQFLSDDTSSYTTPQVTGPVVVPATPVPSSVEKDLSGFGDADDDFEFEEID